MQKPYAESTLQKKYKATGVADISIFWVKEYLLACANFYKVIELDEAWRIIDQKYNPTAIDNPITKDQFDSLVPILRKDDGLDFYIFSDKDLFDDGDDEFYLISESFLEKDTIDCDIDKLHENYTFTDIGELSSVIDDWSKFYELHDLLFLKPIYVPKDLLSYSAEEYFEETEQVKAVRTFLQARVHRPGFVKAIGKPNFGLTVVNDALRSMVEVMKCPTIPFDQKVRNTREVYEYYSFEPLDEEGRKTFIDLAYQLRDNTRVPMHRGHTQVEVRSISIVLPTNVKYTDPGIEKEILHGKYTVPKVPNNSTEETLPSKMAYFQQVHEKKESQPVSKAGIAKPGPNDPCPCGSGKKYKKCCGR